MTKPSLLILSDPPIAPGYLPRLRFMCQYLHEHGYNVHLFTEEKEPLLFEHTYPITTIPTYTGSTLDWLMKAVWSLFTNWHERHFSAKVEQAIENEQYSQIICTTFSTFPLGAAVQIARNRHLPLIADIRDVDEQVEHSTYQYAHQQWWLKPFRSVYRTIQLRRRNKAIRQANVITTVSPWHVEFLKQYNPNVHLIYNGFDPDQFYFQAVQTDVFRITYIGSMFGHYDLRPLYQAVNELLLENVIVDIHTPKHQPIAHTELGDTIRKSSIMLVLTNKKTHGMMTTKFSEALGCEKPILCIPSDKGCLADAIQYTNAGLASDNINEIKQFILDKYHEWQQNGYTHQNIHNTDMFNRLNQAKQFERLFTKAMDKGLVSVIVPIYNAAPYLAQCLTSIKMQTYQDLQVILIDDGSTDESGKIAQSFVDADVRFSLIHQPNQGQGAARNKGLEKATGEYLIFVDADDYINTDFIARHIMALGDADYVQSGYQRVSVEGDMLEQKSPCHRYQFTSPCMRLYRMSWIQTRALTFPTNMIYEDVVFSLLLWGSTPKIQFIPYIGYNYTYNPHSTTSIIHKQEQQELLHTIYHLPVSFGIKIITLARLWVHFAKQKY